MDVLTTLVGTLAIAVTTAAQAAPSQDGEGIDPRELAVEKQAKSLCQSTDEYVRTLNFLRNTKEIVLPEASARKVADRVSRGCDGAAERFQKILSLMRRTGFSDSKALEFALLFSGYPTDVQANFQEIFTRAFLGEFFDFDHVRAATLAFELSRDYRGDPAQVRDDFIALSKMCRESQGLDLPMKICAEYAVKLARLSELHPEGIREPFMTLFRKLKEGKSFEMDIKRALEISYTVLKGGPRAPANFLAAYEFALNKDGLNQDRTHALAFGLRMAARSYMGERPPPIPGGIRLSHADSH